MVQRRDVIRAAAAIPLLAGLAPATAVFADDNNDNQGNDNQGNGNGNGNGKLLLNPETISASLAIGGTAYQDSAGNLYIEGAVYTGSAASTITGSCRFDLNVFTPAGSSVSRFWGTFAISDNATPSNIVFGAVAGTQSGTSQSGRFTVNGGLGSFLHDTSSGSVTGSTTAAINTAGILSWTLQSQHGFGPPLVHGHGKND